MLCFSTRRSQNILQRIFFLTCGPFSFTWCVHKTWHLHLTFLVSGRQPSPGARSITAVKSMKIHYNPLTIKLNSMNICVAEHASFLLFFLLVVKYSSFAAEYFFSCPFAHGAATRLLLSPPIPFTAESHLLCLGGVHITDSYWRGNHTAIASARSLFG